MGELTSVQKKHLRGLAHHLSPIVQVGRNGLTDALFEQLDEALEHHELIKVRFLELKEQKRELSAAIDERLGSEQVGMIGNVAIFFRRARDPNRRAVEVPGEKVRVEKGPQSGRRSG